MPQLTDTTDIRARLERDRVWAAFSLADLDPPNAAHAAWFGFPHGEAIVLVYDAYDPPIVFCQGDAGECEAILGEPELRAMTGRAYLNVLPEQWPAVVHQFATFAARPMHRMVLDASASLPAVPSHVVRLGPDDLGGIRTLYAADPPAFFLPSQLETGVYFGVREGSSLIAIAGTHVVSAAARVGAIGNVYTRIDRRGRGLASDVTAAVAHELRCRDTATIVLNVTETNGGARRVYERLGFHMACLFAEGAAQR
jgi:hypothetical protein